MKILSKKEYDNLLKNSKKYLPLKAKLDKINLLLDSYNHGKNIYTVMRDIKNNIREG